MRTMKLKQRSVQPSTTVVTAVATVRGVDVTDLSVPLFEVVDPDALDRLFEAAAGDLSFDFEYHGHHVELRGNDTVLVDGTVVETTR